MQPEPPAALNASAVCPHRKLDKIRPRRHGACAVGASRLGSRPSRRQCSVLRQRAWSPRSCRSRCAANIVDDQGNLHRNRRSRCNAGTSPLRRLVVIRASPQARIRAAFLAWRAGRLLRWSSSIRAGDHRNAPLGHSTVISTTRLCSSWLSVAIRPWSPPAPSHGCPRGSASHEALERLLIQRAIFAHGVSRATRDPLELDASSACNDEWPRIIRGPSAKLGPRGVRCKARRIEESHASRSAPHFRFCFCAPACSASHGRHPPGRHDPGARRSLGRGRCRRRAIRRSRGPQAGHLLPPARARSSERQPRSPPSWPPARIGRFSTSWPAGETTHWPTTRMTVGGRGMCRYAPQSPALRIAPMPMAGSAAPPMPPPWRAAPGLLP